MAALVASLASSVVPSAGARARTGPIAPPVVEEHGPAPPPSRAHVLARAGFTVRSVLPAAVVFMPWRGCDCVVLDAAELGPDLLGVVGALARRDPSPRVLVVAPPSSPDRVRVMLAGADDVITGTVCPRELVARVLSLMVHPVVAVAPPLELGCLVIDRDRREVRVDGTEVSMAPLQYDLLMALVEANGKPVPGDVLLARSWDPHQVVSGGHLRPQLARLRTALGQRCEITWARGAGYVLRCLS